MTIDEMLDSLERRRPGRPPAREGTSAWLFRQAAAHLHSLAVKRQEGQGAAKATGDAKAKPTRPTAKAVAAELGISDRTLRRYASAAGR